MEKTEPTVRLVFAPEDGPSLRELLLELRAPAGGAGTVSPPRKAPARPDGGAPGPFHAAESAGERTQISDSSCFLVTNTLK